MDILVSGAIAYDRILYFNGHFKDLFLAEKVHALSVSFDIQTIDESFGGTGGNIAYNLHLLGLNPLLFSSAGTDYARYSEWFKKLGISEEHIVLVPDMLTSQAHIMTDRDNNQITGFHQGAGSYMYDEPIPTTPDSLAVVAPAHSKNMLHFSKHYQAHGMKYLFDPGQQVPTFSQEDFTACLEGAWIFVANDYEMSLSLAKTGWSEDELKANVPIVITTLGDRGSIVHYDGTSHTIGIAPAEVVTDPTGAGDAYRAGLMKGIALGLPVEKAAQLAATVASYAIEKQGTQNHTFNMEEVASRHHKAFGEKLPL